MNLVSPRDIESVTKLPFIKVSTTPCRRAFCNNHRIESKCLRSVVEWFRVLELKSGGPGSNPPPYYYYLDLFSVIPNSTPRRRCVNSQLVGLPQVGILKSLYYIYNIWLFICSVPNWHNSAQYITHFFQNTKCS